MWLERKGNLHFWTNEANKCLFCRELQKSTKPICRVNAEGAQEVGFRVGTLGVVALDSIIKPLLAWALAGAGLLLPQSIEA